MINHRTLFKVFTVFVFVTALYSSPLRLMTFNIRLDSRSDGPNVWENRRDNLISMIIFHKADLIGLQEVQKHQLDYIAEKLPEFGWFGVGRDDGKTGGEFAAVLYRKSRFDTIQTANFWCSPTPDKPGLGWDAAYIRITTFGKFYDKVSKEYFYLFNTHLDNEGGIARKESALLIRKKINDLCGNLPVILTGDFNSEPDGDAYKSITALSDAKGAINLYDTRLRSATKHHGPNGTFTAFDINSVPRNPIDFIFTSSVYKVLYHATLSDSFDGFLPSDHYPVLAEIDK